MYTSILSATIHGLDAVPVRVEVDVSSGLPGFSMVGNLSSQVRESQDRVKTALHNIHISMPPNKITVNLSPGDIPKNGTGFDLPIAGAILQILGHIPGNNLGNVLVAGEIGLDGRVRGIRGILPIVSLAGKLGCRGCIIPKDNLEEAMLSENIQVIGVDDLAEFITTVRQEKWGRKEKSDTEISMWRQEEVTDSVPMDFADIRGQIPAKRAALLAAAGFHNLLLLGPPGSGKTMIAARISGLLPPLTHEEMLELTNIYSVAGMLSKEHPWIVNRPFRNPHHTISPYALAGGGKIPQPGEITLAHRGVLFLDEFPEMKRASLELLRQPLEDRKIWISRTGGRYCFPADFLLVAAMNPCPCGYFPDRNRCCCSTGEISRYLNRISQPLLDRMDLCAETTTPTYGEFRNKTKEKIWTTSEMRAQVIASQKIQQERYRKEKFQFNGEIPSDKIEKYCVTESDAEKLLKHAFSSLELTGRGCSRILRVARTAADLTGSDIIKEEHMAEAIGYRALDKQYWKFNL